MGVTPQTMDKNLAQKVFELLRLNRNLVDPWRIHQHPDLVAEIAQGVVGAWSVAANNANVDVIAAASELAIPLCMSVAKEARSRELFHDGKLVRVDPIEVLRDINSRWMSPPIGGFLKGKNVLLIDEMISTGQDAFTACRALKGIGATIVLFAVLFDNEAEPNREAYKAVLGEVPTFLRVTYDVFGSQRGLARWQ